MQKGSLWRILTGAHERVTLKCLKEKIKGNVALKQYIFVYLKKTTLLFAGETEGNYMLPHGYTVKPQSVFVENFFSKV